MCFRAGDHHVKPTLPKGTSYDTDRGVMSFEHGTLFDMGFKIGANPFWANVVLTCITDCFECLAHRGAIPILLSQDHVGFKLTNKSA